MSAKRNFNSERLETERKAYVRTGTRDSGFVRNWIVFMESAGETVSRK